MIYSSCILLSVIESNLFCSRFFATDRDKKEGIIDEWTATAFMIV